MAEALDGLAMAYDMAEQRMDLSHWAVGQGFTLADCAAAPALFYAHWGHPIPESQTSLREYRARLLARPSISRVVDEARPWRALFPLKEYEPE